VPGVKILNDARRPLRGIIWYDTDARVPLRYPVLLKKLTGAMAPTRNASIRLSTAPITQDLRYGTAGISFVRLQTQNCSCEHCSACNTAPRIHKSLSPEPNIETPAGSINTTTVIKLHPPIHLPVFLRHPLPADSPRIPGRCDGCDIILRPGTKVAR